MLAPEGNTGSPFQVILIPNQVFGSQIAKFSCTYRDAHRACSNGSH
jgi:hypothetical protein